MSQPLDGPSKPGKLIGVGTVTPVEVKSGASAFEGRQVVTLQSHRLDANSGPFYVYTADDGEVPSAATVADKGLIQPKNAKEDYEASVHQAIYVLSVSGTIDIRITERG